MATDKALSLEGAELLYNDIRARLVGISQGGGGGTGATGATGPKGDAVAFDSSMVSIAQEGTGNNAITDVAVVDGKLVFNRGTSFLLDTHMTMGTNPHRTTAADVGAVPITRTVNGKALSSNISLTYSDVGAAPSSHTHTQYALKHKHSVCYSEDDDSYYQMPSMQVGELMVFNYDDTEYSREIKAPSGGTYIVSGQGLFATGKTVSGGTVFGQMPLHGVILKIS